VPLRGTAYGEAVKRAVVRAAVAGGHTLETAQRFASQIAGHSLRAGFITSADEAGAPVPKIMEQATHAHLQPFRCSYGNWRPAPSIVLIGSTVS